MRGYYKHLDPPVSDDAVVNDRIRKLRAKRDAERALADEAAPLIADLRFGHLHVSAEAWLARYREARGR